MTADRSTLSAIILAIGLAAGGWSVGNGFARGRAAERFVEVKGLAEREVKADLALWPLRDVAPATISASRRPASPAAPGRSSRFFHAMGSTPTRPPVGLSLNPECTRAPG